MIFLGQLLNREHLQKFIQQFQSTEDTEKIELFLEHATIAKNEDAMNLLSRREQHCIYEDHFNQFLYFKVQSKLSFENLKAVCRYYEQKTHGGEADKIMIQHEERTRNSTPYFTDKHLSLDDAQGSALALSFYTGVNSEVVSQAASLIVRQSNGKILSESTVDAFDKAQVVLYYLVKALSYIPFYWGWTTRAVELSDDELIYYRPGCLITWIQFSSSKRGHEVAHTFNFSNRNTYFKIYSLTGRSIKDFSNFEKEDEVLYLPHSTFFVLKHEVNFHGTQHTVYMRQVELGLNDLCILWVDDKIFVENWENKRHMESAATRAFNTNVHFIPKSTTKSAMSFLRSSFGQRLKNKDSFRIVTDMNRENEKPAHNAGARLIKQLRELGFENRCLVFTWDQEKTEQILESELTSDEMESVQVTTTVSDLNIFINFQ
jgi:hypothetical protein